MNKNRLNYGSEFELTELGESIFNPPSKQKKKPPIIKALKNPDTQIETYLLIQAVTFITEQSLLRAEKIWFN